VPYRAAGAFNPGQLLLLTAPVLTRGPRQWVTLTYTGGFLAGAVPADVEHACMLVTTEMLAQRRNPSGAAIVRQGKYEAQVRLRGDITGDSILLLQAKHALEPYRVSAQ